MTSYANRAIAIAAALLLTAATFYEVVTVPALAGPAVVELA